MNPTPQSPDPKPPPTSGHLQPGQAVGAGRYLLKKVLGQGGMGVVWLAHDSRLREPVALKFLPPQIAFDAAALENLRRETLRSRKLSHPNIVRIHDLHEEAGETPFISMEYVDGPNLHFLRVNRPSRVLPWKYLAPLLRQLCVALDYAHGERVVHRDLKPANLMLDSNGRLKLADFGLARVALDAASPQAGQTHTAGTLDFMSPQQADGQKAQVSDDIYSLGATLYDLLTSTPPFYTGDIAYQVRHTRPQHLRERLLELGLENDIPSEVAALIMACLAKEPAKRPESAAYILSWLEAVVKHEAKKSAAPAPAGQVVAPPGSPALEQGPREETPTGLPAKGGTTNLPAEGGTTNLPPEGGTTNRATPMPRRSRKLAVAAVLLLVAGVAGLGVWQWVTRGPAPRDPARPASEPPTASAGAPASSPAASVSVPSPAPGAGFVSLFNGRDLTGWTGDAKVWSVRDGVITGQLVTRTPADEPCCLIWRGEDLVDFELRVAFRLLSGNSGIYYRARELTNWMVGGYQFELLGRRTGNLIETGKDRPRRDLARDGARTLARRVNGQDSIQTLARLDGQKEIGALIRNGDWNEATIIARGGQLAQYINERLVAECTDESPARAQAGLLALEITGGPGRVEFKDIRLQRLPAPEPRP